MLMRKGTLGTTVALSDGVKNMGHSIVEYLVVIFSLQKTSGVTFCITLSLKKIDKIKDN